MMINTAALRCGVSVARMTEQARTGSERYESSKVAEHALAYKPFVGGSGYGQDEAGRESGDARCAVLADQHDGPLCLGLHRGFCALQNSL